MNIENVSYRYSLAEFYALLRLTGCDGVPFRSQEEPFAEGLSSLEDSFLATSAGTSVTLDRVAAFLAHTVGSCRQCVCLRGGGFWGLYYSHAASVFLWLHGGQWVVSPFQTWDSALEALLGRLPRTRAEREICLLNAQGQWQRPCPAPGETREVLRQAAGWALSNEIPSGKDATLWKP